MAKSMKPELVALSAGLILSVYSAGYLLTTPAASVGHAAASASTAQSAGAPAAPQATPHAKAVRYRDGTYTATGVSSLGTVTAAVSIQGGRVKNVQITGYTMHYSEEYIAGLPAEVLAAQSAAIDWVSGASYSSYSFASAVAQALAQASGQSPTAAANAAANVQPAGWVM